MVTTKVTKKPYRATQAERTEESRRRMLSAGVKLIIAHGPNKLTLRDVGALAGYSRGLVNYRFGTKEGLFEEIFVEGRNLWQATLKSAVGEKTGLAALIAALDAMKDFFSNLPELYLANLILWYTSIGGDSPAKNRLIDKLTLQRNDVRRWLEKGIADREVDPRVDAKSSAAVFCSFVYGLTYQWIVEPDAIDVEAVIDEGKIWILGLRSVE